MSPDVPVMHPRSNPDGTVVIRTPAKVNLYLEVLARRPDGYHDIDSIVEAIDFCDTLYFHSGPRGIRVRADHPRVPAGGENLAVRAAELFYGEIGQRPRLTIQLSKRIPPGSGLGGASANAVGTLFALQELSHTPLRHDSLLHLACRLGSDVPFFLYGGLAHLEGRGDRVTVLGAPRPRRYLLLLPHVALQTRDVYAALTLPLTSAQPLGSMSAEAVEELIGSGVLFFNRLQQTAFAKEPLLREIQEGVAACGLRAVLTGSGSCLFAPVPKEVPVEGIKEKLGVLRKHLAVATANNLPPWRYTSEKEGGSGDHQRSGSSGTARQ